MDRGVIGGKKKGFAYLKELTTGYGTGYLK
jgi:hypothetical protein